MIQASIGKWLINVSKRIWARLGRPGRQRMLPLDCVSLAGQKASQKPGELGPEKDMRASRTGLAVDP